jgi:predicted ATP-grasp superfamily ATP-dependent carboligase
MRSTPIVLTMADYYGTLAAARCLGERGVPVIVAEAQLLAPTRWSRWVTRQVQAPRAQPVDRFVEWLLELGHREPGHVLYPTSDDLAWAFSRHERDLSRVFRMYQPSAQTMLALLDKQILYESCRASGLETARTWFPENVAEVERIAREAEFPVIVKPRSQALFPSRMKGTYVSAPEALAPRYEAFMRRFHHDPSLVEVTPGIAHPMIQEYHPQAVHRIYSLSGFIDKTGRLFVVRGAMKVLQRPRMIGQGICFEDAPVEPRLAAGIARLCGRTGYYGVFEAELICHRDRYLLIDFNPRFYGQMAFDVARNAPLPLFVYLAACGDDAELAEAVTGAQTYPKGAAFCHWLSFAILLRAQRLAGRMPASEVENWLRWRRKRQPADAVLDARDPIPIVAETMAQALEILRHPRGTLRGLVFDPAM